MIYYEHMFLVIEKFFFFWHCTRGWNRVSITISPKHVVYSDRSKIFLLRKEKKTFYNKFVSKVQYYAKKNAPKMLITIAVKCVIYQPHLHGEPISRKIARLVTITILFLRICRRGGGI